MPAPRMEEEIVISGISGRFPECNSVEEFQEQLYAGIDMITETPRRWPTGLYGLPARGGSLKNLEYFDATFFGVHPKQADAMDPQLRIMLELTYEALIDAGINPYEIRGSKTGVFVGVSLSESLEYWNRDFETTSGYGLLGGSMAMLANRISFSFDFNGPSYPCDTACAAGMYSLDQAIMSMRSGLCDSAIVTGVNLLLKPCRTLQFQRLSMLNDEGTCKSFDASGNGYVRSEAAVVMYIQRISEAKRVYAIVAGSKINTDGYKQKGITFPSGEMQYRLLKELYDEANISPLKLGFMEAHGTGTKAGDPQELNALTEMFCKNRKEPLLIGSIKSNIGHTESASGLCSIVKVILSMETGIIPKNLHFKTPNPDAPALSDGRMKVITENQPWNGGYVGINSLGFGGTNSHVILKSFTKPKAPKTTEKIPRIITVSGRTEQAVDTFLTKLEKHADDNELMALVYDIHKRNINGHGYRGYLITGENPEKEISEVPNERRPTWFIYSGMGSQWCGMGKDMMKLDLFRNSIEKCSRALKPYGINLEEIIMTMDETTFDNVLNSFLAITSIQVALTDVLLTLGVRPDGYVGHSVGEVGCAYADNTITAEQAILTAYSRGKSVLESQLPPGAMASVGLTWEECARRCPPGVYPACHNSEDNVTISGPPETVQKFIKELTAENIFAKEVKSSGHAFHSIYMAAAGDKLRTALKEIIPNPKQRSSKWISSSILENSWSTPLGLYSSADYHVNNLLSPVQFYEAVKQIPKNSLVIEIAPHGLLIGIMKRILGSESINIGLMRRGHKDNLQLFMSNLGKIYNAGPIPKVAQLYTPVTFPVGRGTPMLQSMIEWDHSLTWTVPDFVGKGGRTGETVITVDLSNEADNFMAGHTVDGRMLYPGTGYLVLVWKTFAKIHNQDYEKIPVIFEDINIHRATIMPKSGAVKFTINILEGNGEFTICEGDSLIMSGKISTTEDTTNVMYNLPQKTKKQEKETVKLQPEDVYKELQLRGYNYGESFREVLESDMTGECGLIKWEKNWVTYTDAMMHFSIIGLNTKELYVPTRIQKFIIDPIKHLDYVNSFQNEDGEFNVPVNVYRELGVVRSGGVEVHNMNLTIAPKRIKQAPPKHERYLLIPYDNNTLLAEDFEEAIMQSLTVLMQIVMENSKTLLKLKITEIAENKPSDELLTPTILEIIEKEPEFTVDYTIVTTQSTQLYETTFESLNVNIVQKETTKNIADQNLHLVVVHDVLRQKKYELLNNALDALKEGGMILVEEQSTAVDEPTINKLGLELVSRHVIGSTAYALLRKPIEIPSDKIVIQVTENNFNWVEPVANAMKKANLDGTKVYLYVQNEETTGIIGLATCLLREPGGMNVRVVFIQDKKSEKFSLTSPFFVKQLKKDLVFNVLRNGVWGSYRHILLDYSIDNGPKKMEHAYLNTLIKGDLTSLAWIESPLKNYKNNNPKKELCSVYYAALNFRDVMLASGKLPSDALPNNLAEQECILGLEFSGLDSKGRRVMGMAAAQSLATTVLADKEFLWEVPDKWSLEEAATIPIAYATAYYALIIRGRMKPGESILVHAGSGAVGQAAIVIALSMDCTVFTTVSTQVKRDFLKKRFPQISDKNIGNSRDTSFKEMILLNTNGRGVDLILNSLAEEKLQASLHCIGKHGRFLELGKLDFSNNASLGMAVFLKNVSFHGILLDALIEAEYYDKNKIWNLVNEGIKAGIVCPLPTTVFSENQAEQAFRFIANAKHIGKVLIKIRDEEKGNQKPKPKLISALPRTYMNPDKSYILSGGLGAFGMELTKWLISRGATKIFLVSRTGLQTGYQHFWYRRWKEMGINVIVSTADLTTESGTKKLLEEANKLGPVGAIFNLAAVVYDAMMEDQTAEKFRLSCKPKVEITKNLDKFSRVMCPQLDYFMVWSSLSCGRGNEGQSNYGYSNSAMERICEARKAAGYPCFVYQTSGIGDVGLTISLIGSNENTIRGTHPQVIPSSLQTIDKFLQHHEPYPILCTMVVAEKHRSNVDSTNVSLPEAVANILGIKDIKTAPLQTTLSDLGMDSLMGDEVKQTLERNYDIVMSPHEIRSLTFSKLNEMSNSGASS